MRCHASRATPHGASAWQHLYHGAHDPVPPTDWVDVPQSRWRAPPPASATQPRHTGKDRASWRPEGGAPRRSFRRSSMTGGPVGAAALSSVFCCAPHCGGPSSPGALGVVRRCREDAPTTLAIPMLTAPRMESRARSAPPNMHAQCHGIGPYVSVRNRAEDVGSALDCTSLRAHAHLRRALGECLHQPSLRLRDPRYDPRAGKWEALRESMVEAPAVCWRLPRREAASMSRHTVLASGDFPWRLQSPCVDAHAPTQVSIALEPESDLRFTACSLCPQARFMRLPSALAPDTREVRSAAQAVNCLDRMFVRPARRRRESELGTHLAEPAACTPPASVVSGDVGLQRASSSPLCRLARAARRATSDALGRAGRAARGAPAP